MGSQSKQAVLVRGRLRAADTRECVRYVCVCVHAPSRLKSLDGPIACCLLEKMLTASCLGVGLMFVVYVGMKYSLLEICRPVCAAGVRAV